MSGGVRGSRRRARSRARARASSSRSARAAATSAAAAGFGEYLTAALPYDADAAAVKSAIEALPGAGDVYVARSAAGSEGGATYAVTFATAKGDVAPLLAQSSLTGQGAAVTTLELTKGSEAIGSALAVSFDAPLFCSQSQVDPSSGCGAPVTRRGRARLDRVVPASPTIVSVPADYSVQTVRVGAASLPSLAPYGMPSVGGVFRLSYTGATTAPLNAAASAAELRHALEALPDVATVSVSRGLSWERVPGLFVDAAVGFPHVWCAGGADCDWAGAYGLVPSELLRFGADDAARTTPSRPSSARAATRRAARSRSRSRRRPRSRPTTSAAPARPTRVPLGARLRVGRHVPRDGGRGAAAREPRARARARRQLGLDPAARLRGCSYVTGLTPCS